MLSASRPVLLLTNDDGISADGLVALEHALSPVAELYVIAPESNRSAVSNHLTMGVPLVVTPLSSRRFSSSGTPVDCVITALRSGLCVDAAEKPVRFDAVLSGINAGANMGTDIVYSGTAAAARQAALYGVPGVALSLSPSSDGLFLYGAFASFVADNLHAVIALAASAEGAFVNINAPSADAYKDVVYSTLCRRDYHDTVAIKKRKDGRLESLFLGGNIQSFSGLDGDFYTVENGSIAVSLVAAEPCALPKSGSIPFSL